MTEEASMRVAEIPHYRRFTGLRHLALPGIVDGSLHENFEGFQYPPSRGWCDSKILSNHDDFYHLFHMDDSTGPKGL